MHKPTVSRQDIYKKGFRVLLTLIILSLPLLTQTSAFAQDGGGAIPTITAVITDDGVELSPSEVPAGLVTFTLENNRSEGHFIPSITRLKDGISIDDLMVALEEDEMAAVMTMLTLYGGGSVAAGESLSYTTELPAGEYAIAEEDGNFTRFTVIEGNATDVAEPEADIQLAMVDFGFGIPAFIPTGPQVWHLQNVGDQWHHFAIFLAPAGISSVADVRTAMAAGEQEPELVLQWSPMEAGTQGWVTLDLEPGTYVLICFLPDITGDFSSHMDHGMMQIFTVE